MPLTPEDIEPRIYQKRILGIDDDMITMLKKAAEKLKGKEIVTTVKVRSMKPLDKIGFTVSRREITNIFGITVLIDESIAADEYKVIYANGREELHKWTS